MSVGLRAVVGVGVAIGELDLDRDAAATLGRVLVEAVHDMADATAEHTLDQRTHAREANDPVLARHGQLVLSDLDVHGRQRAARLALAQREPDVEFIFVDSHDEELLGHLTALHDRDKGLETGSTGRRMFHRPHY